MYKVYRVYNIHNLYTTYTLVYNRLSNQSCIRCITCLKLTCMTAVQWNDAWGGINTWLLTCMTAAECDCWPMKWWGGACTRDNSPVQIKHWNVGLLLIKDDVITWGTFHGTCWSIFHWSQCKSAATLKHCKNAHVGAILIEWTPRENLKS